MRAMWLMLAMALSACSGLVPKDENSSYYPVPVGSKLILHRDLTIPPHSARVYLQDGKVVKAPGTTKAYCRFEVNDVLSMPQTLRADEFIVRKTQMDSLIVSSLAPQRLAATFGFRWGNSEDVTLVWDLWLDSPSQPNVRRLICGGPFDYPARARRPSINEIREQLGAIASLQIVPDVRR